MTLSPITPNDIPTLAHLSHLAFLNDRQTQFKASDPIDPYNHFEAMTGALQHWLSTRSSGETDMVKATNGNGRVVGWVVWGIRNGLELEGQQEQHGTGHEGSIRCDQSPASSTTKSPPKENHEPPQQSTNSSKSPRRRLEEYTSSNLQSWMLTLMPPGSLCMYIASICVHPEHQGKGIGSALLKYGTDRADKEKLYCWVQSSEAGSNLFEQDGFEEVGRLEIDLDEWSCGEVEVPVGEESWGVYVLRYMRREALLRR